jgi:hypothetical protein
VSNQRWLIKRSSSARGRIYNRVAVNTAKESPAQASFKRLQRMRRKQAMPGGNDPD